MSGPAERPEVPAQPEMLALPGLPTARAAGIVGIGVDAVDVARYRAVLARTPSIAERTFTERELAYARQQDDPTQRLAVRFAAKEATMKALGVGLGACRLRDIEVVRATSGAPGLALRGAASELAAAIGAASMLVTLTHTDTVAVAYVLALAAP